MVNGNVGSEVGTTPKYTPLAREKRQGVGLCLSGGGYRATLFHLGALRRLNAFGVLTRQDFRSVSSVSGGSIVAAALAGLLREHSGPAGAPIPAAHWEDKFRKPVRAFTRRNIRTGAVAKRLLPLNWFRSSTGVRALAQAYEAHLTQLRLVDLPANPNFIFCATDMSYGVNWVFERDRVGDYQAGYRSPPATDMPLGRAVAASSCFPPVFNPLPAEVEPSELKGGLDQTKGRDKLIRGLKLTDGGNYDNMGLEPVWKSHACVLVSDAGAPFPARPDDWLLPRLWRYQAIQANQSAAVRKRWLISNFIEKEMDGTYWGISSSVSSYGPGTGYAEDLAKTVISEIRTDLDAFSDAEAAVLENHGYLLADAGLRTHVTALLPSNPPPLQIPHVDWMDEEAVRGALSKSHKRKMLGRF